MKKNEKFDRRKFIIGSGFGLGVLASQDPVVSLFNSIYKGITNQVVGQNSNTIKKYLIQFMYFGGKPPYFGELALRPNGNDQILSNPNMFTTFVNGNKSYQQAFIDGYYLPHIWSQTIPTPNGTWVPMEDAAHNCMLIRGLNMISNSHETSQVFASTKQFGNRTVSGVLADEIGSKFPLPMVAVDSSPNRATCNYTESSTSFCTRTANGNPINNLFGPFTISNKVRLMDSTNARTLASSLVESLGKHKNDVFKSRLNLVHKNAMDLFMNAYDGFIMEYDALKNKYQNLIVQSITTRNMQGINNQAVNIVNGNIEYANKTDNGNVQYPNVNDLRDHFENNANIDNLSTACAISEFLVKHEFSCSIFNAIGNIRGISNDCHTSGAMHMWLGFSLGFRAQMACIHELIRSLKSYGKFDDTLIIVNSEFGRSARQNTVNGVAYGTGADHSGESSYCSLFNGKINSLQMTGNIKIDSGNNGPNSYPGTWGQAAPISAMGKEIRLGNLISTMSEILDIPSTTNEESLVSKVAGYWEAKYDPMNI